MLALITTPSASHLKTKDIGGMSNLRDKLESIAGYNLEYAFFHPHKVIANRWRHLKWFMQRGWRGYADCDVWSLDGYLATWMPQAVRKIPGVGYFQCGSECGMPDDILAEGRQEKDQEHYNEVIEKIARAFEAHLERDDIWPNDDDNWKEKHAVLAEETREGLKLMAIHYGGLWN